MDLDKDLQDVLTDFSKWKSTFSDCMAKLQIQAKIIINHKNEVDSVKKENKYLMNQINRKQHFINQYRESLSFYNSKEVENDSLTSQNKLLTEKIANYAKKSAQTLKSHEEEKKKMEEDYTNTINSIKSECDEKVSIVTTELLKEKDVFREKINAMLLQHKLETDKYERLMTENKAVYEDKLSKTNAELAEARLEICYLRQRCEATAQIDSAEEQSKDQFPGTTTNEEGIVQVVGKKEQKVSKTKNPKGIHIIPKQIDVQAKKVIFSLDPKPDQTPNLIQTTSVFTTRTQGSSMKINDNETNGVENKENNNQETFTKVKSTSILRNILEQRKPNSSQVENKENNNQETFTKVKSTSILRNILEQRKPNSSQHINNSMDRRPEQAFNLIQTVPVFTSRTIHLDFKQHSILKKFNNDKNEVEKLENKKQVTFTNIESMGALRNIFEQSAPFSQSKPTCSQVSSSKHHASLFKLSNITIKPINAKPVKHKSGVEEKQMKKIKKEVKQNKVISF